MSRAEKKARPAGQTMLHSGPELYGFGFRLLFDRADDAAQVALILANDLDGVAVIQAHHAQDALGIGNAALHIVHADRVITFGGSRHDSLDLREVGNLDLFHHCNDLQTISLNEPLPGSDAQSMLAARFVSRAGRTTMSCFPVPVLGIIA